jgi:SAM-dependent methyltransferase
MPTLPAEPFELLITDQDSTDGTAEWLAELECSDPTIRILRPGRNTGISEGKNRALAEARGEFFVSLDNDAVVGHGWLEGLRAGFSSPEVAQVGRSHTYGRLDPGGCGVGGTDPLEYVDGSCFMVRSEVAREVGLCDPTFYGLFGCEDADFSLRLRLRGYSIAVRAVAVDHSEAPPHVGHGVSEDLRGVRELAHHKLRQRWGHYLKTRRFDARVVIRRTGSLGDVILASPLPRLIQAAWPAARISVATNHPEVFAGNPHIVGIVPPAAAPALSDYLYDLDGEYEAHPELSVWDAYVRKINTESVVRIVDERAVPELHSAAPVSTIPAQPYVVVHLQPTAWPGRNVPERLWLPIADEIRRRGFVPLSVGRPPAPIGSEVHNLSFGQLTTMIQNSAGFVGIDSAPFHVAQAFKKPSVVFFGSIDPSKRCLHNTIAVVQQEHLDCLGCHHRAPAPRFDWAGCERGDLACMETLEIGRVRSALGRVFFMSETSKIRDRVKHYFETGRGADIGCGHYEKIVPEAIGMDAEGADINMDLNDPPPFPHGSLDWIWSSHCLEHLHNYPLVLRHWWDAIRPGGLLGLYLPHRDYYDNAWNADHKHAFLPEHITEVIEAMGGEIVESDLDVDDVPLSERPTRYYQTERYSFLVIARKPL